jgi:hypothetical protein
LTESVVFKAVLQRGNKVQVPRLLRWQYRMEPDQVLRVEVRSFEFSGCERFLGRMRRDGRLTIPLLTLKLLRGDDEGNLEGYVLEVTLEPAEETDEKPG